MNVGILGYGHVAAATLQSFLQRADLIAAKSRQPITFTRIATRSPERARGHVPEDCMVDSDVHALVTDPDIDVVTELTGNVPLARELVLLALAHGKHVITANKALLAHHGTEIMTAAATAGRRVLFEGAVAVSIPIVKFLRESAAANHITSITGILNGTSNYVLSQMSGSGADFASALAEAQRLGYAEADPSLDISGEDAAHKITLLAALAFGIPINFEHVQFAGITSLDPVDIKFAKRMGYHIKLIAQAQRVSEQVSIRVQPMLVSSDTMLAQVQGSMNGIAVQGDLLGSAFLYGSGAGGKQTASAVLADLLELANGVDSNASGGAYNMGFREHATQPSVTCQTSTPERHYLRMTVDASTVVCDQIPPILGHVGIRVHRLMHETITPTRSHVAVLTEPIERHILMKCLSHVRSATDIPDGAVSLPVLATGKF